MSISVASRFEKLLTNLRLTDLQQKDGVSKAEGVASCLSRRYYGATDHHSNSLYVGSWGKNTVIRPPRDVDLMFVLPYEVYRRFQQRAGNRQSQLLQEVKLTLATTYPSTEMRGDGQVVVVRFDSFAVEVVPAFRVLEGQFLICDTNCGGSYQRTDPLAELSSIDYADKHSNGNARDLIRMMKRWQEFCSVPLKSFYLEILVTDFIGKWSFRRRSTVYYDWMVRDFFAYLASMESQPICVPGTYEIIWLGSEWISKVRTAYARAIKACDHEAANLKFLAGEEWQKIFGNLIPISIL